MAYGLTGRATAVEWPHVVMLGAGQVLRTEFEHKVKEHRRYVVVNPYIFSTGGVGMMETVRTEHKDEEERVFRFTLEAFVNVPPGRYHVSADRFSFEYLGERLSPSRAGNFANLVRDCLAHAGAAILNKGAMALRGDRPAMVRYPSRHAFEEELTWLLWRHFVWPHQREGGR